MLVAQMSQSCPRCNRNDGTECVSPPWPKSLDEQMLAYLNKTEYESLCASCLDELEATVREIANEAVPIQNRLLVEGKDFYLMNELKVFTERYHIAKGYCCKSNCRHCAYGYGKVPPKAYQDPSHIPRSPNHLLETTLSDLQSNYLHQLKYMLLKALNCH